MALSFASRTGVSHESRRRTQKSRRYSRVGGRNKRRAELEALASELRGAESGDVDRTTAALTALFSARATYGEIKCLDLGGRDGVLDRLRTRGSDEERRLARRLINAWNAVTLVGRAADARRDALIGTALPRSARTPGRGGGRRRVDDAEWDPVESPRGVIDEPDEPDEPTPAFLDGDDEAEWAFGDDGD